MAFNQPEESPMEVDQPEPDQMVRLAIRLQRHQRNAQWISQMNELAAHMARLSIQDVPVPMEIDPIQPGIPPKFIFA